VNVYSDFTIPAFGRHVAVFSHEFMKCGLHHLLRFLHYDEDRDEMTGSVMMMMMMILVVVLVVEMWMTASYFAAPLRNVAELSLLAGSKFVVIFLLLFQTFNFLLHISY
jgi:hypothetical protein